MAHAPSVPWAHAFFAWDLKAAVPLPAVTLGHGKGSEAGRGVAGSSRAVALSPSRRLGSLAAPQPSPRGGLFSALSPAVLVRVVVQVPFAAWQPSGVCCHCLFLALKCRSGKETEVRLQVCFSEKYGRSQGSCLPAGLGQLRAVGP